MDTELKIKYLVEWLKNGGEPMPHIIEDFKKIKLDKSNKIIDAYQYTLEWAELPCQYDLYKMNSSDILLENNLDINLLKFTRTDYWDEKDKLFKENGIVRLN